LLNHLPTPSLLKELSLGPELPEPDEIIEDILPSLTGLTRLHIYESPFDLFSPALLVALRHSSIHTLTLHGTETSADCIIELVDGSGRLPKLRTISLSGQHCTALRTGEDSDTWAAEWGISAKYCQLAAAPFRRSWKLPEWDEEMEGRAEEVLEVAKKNGIEVERSIVEGVEADRAFAKEAEEFNRRLRDIGHPEIEDWDAVE
jgi:hypothetical protein